MPCIIVAKKIIMKLANWICSVW